MNMAVLLENRARFFLRRWMKRCWVVGKGFPIEVRMNGDDFVEARHASG